MEFTKFIIIDLNDNLMIRIFQIGDFELLLDLANQTVPFAEKENQNGWRTRFDSSNALRISFRWSHCSVAWIKVPTSLVNIQLIVQI